MRERFTTAGAAILLLVTIRSLAEVYRLEFRGRRRLVDPSARLFVAGGLVAALAQAATWLIRSFGCANLAVAIPPATVAVLFVWKVFFDPAEDPGPQP